MIIRKIRPEELKRCCALSALAFEYPMEGAEQSPEDFIREVRERPRSLEDLRWDSRWAAFEDDDATMMATFCVLPWWENFDGHEVVMGGIGGVASLPQYRRGGAIRCCFEAALPDMYARGILVGLTRGTGRAHIVRAALESIAYQTRDVLEAMMKDSGLRPDVLRVDGGASNNNFLMQFQSDILGVNVLRPAVTETTAMGAAMLAGRAIGLWDDKALARLWQQGALFSPRMPATRKEALYSNWTRAVQRAKGWETV